MTVVGSLAAQAASEWRAGRLLKAPALLRRPARYLNDGVPDQERVLARRGIALVGSVKSAALVEVTSRGTWLDEACVCDNGLITSRSPEDLEEFCETAIKEFAKGVSAVQPDAAESAV